MTPEGFKQYEVNWEIDFPFLSIMSVQNQVQSGIAQIMKDAQSGTNNMNEDINKMKNLSDIKKEKKETHVYRIKGSCTCQSGLDEIKVIEKIIKEELSFKFNTLFPSIDYDPEEREDFKEVIINKINKLERNNLNDAVLLENKIIIEKVLATEATFLFKKDGTDIITEANTQSNDKSDGPVIVHSDEGNKDGQNKCPKCGSTEITINTNTGKLKCRYCRYEFEPEKVSGFVEDISTLSGQVIGSGAQDIVANTNDVITFKCSSCGAEVVVDIQSAPQARCHWCRNTLSVNQQIPNGTIPDVVLPFNVTRDAAKFEIEKFVGGRKFFAHPKFKKEFTTNNIMGVYFPYMIVDVNAHAKLVGEGEHQTRKYYVTSGNTQQPRYDADLFHVEREYDLTINGLSIESNTERLNTTSETQTNNIINSIMPFDVENCAKYNSNYLKGYTSEKRNINIDQIKDLIDIQSKDISRHAVNETLKTYDRGVKWSSESLDVKGQQWKTAYLPVWLYSYQQVRGEYKLLHYVAVNARTKETMGSVPIHMPKLIFFSILVEILGILAMMFVDFDYNWAFLLSGIIFFVIILAKYRNSGARHTYEKDTKTNITNLKKVDTFIKSMKGLDNSYMYGSNNHAVRGQTTINKIINNTNTTTNENQTDNSIKKE